MRAEIIAIGDELVSGQRLDTNSQWLSQRLGEIGIPVHWHSTVGDLHEDNLSVFRNAAERADLIFTTGGLGPTADDLTREVIAEVSGQPLELHEEVLEHIANLFSSRGRDMPDRNRVQAMFPKGSRVVHNPHGTAPGIDIAWQVNDKHHTRLIALPGVPAEIKDMWSDSVQQTVLGLTGKPLRVIQYRCLKCFGVGESDLERRLPDIIRRGREPQVGITVSRATITLRIAAIAESEDACQSLIAPTEQLIRETLGTLVFGEEDDEIQDSVLRLLQQQNKTLAVVENATGGLVANWMSEVDPLHQHFLGGIVAPFRPAASSLDKAKSSNQRFVISTSSKEELEQLARLAHREFEADYIVVVGASPERLELSEDDADRHSVRFAFFDGQRVISAAHPVAGHPDIIRHRTAKQAIDLVRRRMLS